MTLDRKPLRREYLTGPYGEQAADSRRRRINGTTIRAGHSTDTGDHHRISGDTDVLGVDFFLPPPPGTLPPPGASRRDPRGNVRGSPPADASASHSPPRQVSSTALLHKSALPVTRALVLTYWGPGNGGRWAGTLVRNGQPA